MPRRSSCSPELALPGRTWRTPGCSSRRWPHTPSELAVLDPAALRQPNGAKHRPAIACRRSSSASPELDPTSLDQIAALPLGGRVRLDPWSARIELMKNNRVSLCCRRARRCRSRSRR